MLAEWLVFCPQDFIIDLGFPPEEGATFIKITSIIQAELSISLTGSRQGVCNLTLPSDLIKNMIAVLRWVGAALGANTTGLPSEDAASMKERSVLMLFSDNNKSKVQHV